MESYKIAVASGKGGTGKTSVSVNICYYLKKQTNYDITLVDCDVEEPNDRIFYSNANKISSDKIVREVALINNNECNYCRRCVEYCEFNAIVVIPSAQYAEINSSLCHSCGACLVACKSNAIYEEPEQIGDVNYYSVTDNMMLAEGVLKIGSTMQTAVIRELKSKVGKRAGITVLDSPPGTSCPVVETVSDADYVVLVTEPTPFGLHDLKLAVDVLKELEVNFGVVVNKSGIGTNDVYDYLNRENLELIGEIPFIKEYAGNYAKGELTNNIPESIDYSYRNITDSLIQYLAIEKEKTDR
ncbi:MAG: ATP-binding protein [Bacteroidales bacterium]|jgi:MinD superfamily P-loop ATPase|nr:ATP-binding protein [Bacteroidales bacterium]